MGSRDLKFAGAGALAALALVLAIGGSTGRLNLGAAGASHRSDPSVTSARASSAMLGSSSVERPFQTANENLVDQVREHRRRIEALGVEKASLEESLKKAEARLAAAQAEGGAPLLKNEWDLGESEWAELAKKGQVNWRTPCYDRDGWTPASNVLSGLGLTTQDGATLRGAYERSYERLWTKIKPICAKALGSPSNELLEKIGPDACVHLVYDIELAIDKAATMEAHTQVAEIRAGLRPEPPAGVKVHPVLELFLLLTRANGAFEADLAKTLGPDEAHRLAFADELCHDKKRVGGGVKR